MSIVKLTEEWPKACNRMPTPASRVERSRALARLDRATVAARIKVPR